MRFLILLFIATLWSFPLEAAELKLAVVDVEKILNISEAGRSVQKQLKEKREAYQKEFTTVERKLKSSEEKIIKDKANLSAEDLAEKRQDFRKQIMQARELFQKRRSSLEKALGKSMGELRKNILQVTAEVADEGAYNMILTRDSVVIVEKSMEITDKVLSRLNKKVKKIKLDVKE